MTQSTIGKAVKKVVLAYSGGLDTSIILKWLQTTEATRPVIIMGHYTAIR